MIKIIILGQRPNFHKKGLRNVFRFGHFYARIQWRLQGIWSQLNVLYFLFKFIRLAVAMDKSWSSCEQAELAYTKPCYSLLCSTRLTKIPAKTGTVTLFYFNCQAPDPSPDFSHGTRSWLCFPPVTTTTTTRRTTPTKIYHKGVY